MKELAQQYNFQVEQTSADIDEQALGDRSADPNALVLLLARAKADAIREKLDRQSGLLVTCDQVVTCNGSILEKPQNASEVNSNFAALAPSLSCECQ
jgi:predicted house-cleaning NTP pyrophosphatase (Maf/HAM1 superfamily)